MAVRTGANRGLNRFGPETVGLQTCATSGASRESSLTDRAGAAHGRGAAMHGSGQPVPRMTARSGSVARFARSPWFIAFFRSARPGHHGAGSGPACSSAKAMNAGAGTKASVKGLRLPSFESTEYDRTRFAGRSATSTNVPEGANVKLRAARPGWIDLAIETCPARVSRPS
jgi:hypothetical protein